VKPGVYLVLIDCVFLGGTIDRTMVFCSSLQEQQEWLEHLHAYTKEGSPVGTIVKVIRTQCQHFFAPSLSVPMMHSYGWIVIFVCVLQSVDGKPSTITGTSSHHLHGFGTPAANRGPLEPPKITKPWSLSCLRPAPPLKPSAALGYKEVCCLENSHKRSWVGA